ncbi:MAG: hypothetical protein ACE5DI_01975 [Candidatus Micrarchaeia archaeon]
MAKNAKKKEEPSSRQKNDAVMTAIVIAAAVLVAFIAYNYANSAPSSYYGQLKEVCLETGNPSCCIASVNTMEQGNHTVRPKGGCPQELQTTMLKCIDSYLWCEAKPAVTPKATPFVACVEETANGERCVGKYSGILTYYCCKNGQWNSDSLQNVPLCNVNAPATEESFEFLEKQCGEKVFSECCLSLVETLKERTPIESPTPPPYVGKNSSTLITELKEEVDKITKNALTEKLFCQENSLQNRREFSCASARKDGRVRYSFTAINTGEKQTLPVEKETITTDGRKIVYEKTRSGDLEIVDVYMLCHAEQTLFHYFVPATNDENKVLTNTLTTACPQ